MWRGLNVLACVLAGAALVGCPDWSRPDPRLRTAGRAGATTTPTTPTPVATPERPASDPVAAAELRGVDALREGVSGLKASLGAPDALTRLERLEALGWNLLERGTPDEQREAEGLLEQLTELRAELVGRRGGS